MEIDIFFHDSVILPDPESERVLSLRLDDEATVASLTNELKIAYPSIFDAATVPESDIRRMGRVCIFAGSEHLHNPSVRLRDKIRPGLRLSVAMLLPIRGG